MDSATGQDRTPLVSRLVALLDHLGLPTAHFATQMPGDVADLAQSHPRRIAGLVLTVPVRLDPAPFAGIANRTLILSGEFGIGAPVADRAVAALPGAQRHVLTGYDAPGWADVARERQDEVVAALSHFLGHGPAATTASRPTLPVPTTGRHAGLTWRAEGSGPALLLLPFFLAASQWEPVIGDLAKRFTVIRVGGANIGGVATLEDRARAPSYQAMFRTLIDQIAPTTGEPILDVGCGSGALDRALARRLGAGTPITAMDLNQGLLSEAIDLAQSDGLGERIRFIRGSAEALPFSDASFGSAFSITVLEECDAAKAIREMMRVVKPGGRVGVVVRAIDMPQWWSFPVPARLRSIAETPPQSVGKGGVADARLYAMMQDAGLEDLVPFPSLVTLDNPDGPLWRYREDAILASLDPEARRDWEAARDTAKARKLLFQANALHCAVGTRPA
jgi:SAM-dependent methyltransferase